MCKECGCGEGRNHAHAHAHDDRHAHDHDHGPARGATRDVRLETKVLSMNDAVAAANRDWLRERNVAALNLISAPGTGKTLLLERTLERLRGKIPCAVVTGDQRTDNDARRLQGKGAPVAQIETLNACHLDAERVRRAMPDVIREDTRLLFIENVGNLVCPAAYDLGETCKVALMSVTEGEDKPVKYPALFTRSPTVIVTKTDLLPHLDWDMELCRNCIRRVQPSARIIELSAKSGQGMDAWLEYLARVAPEPPCP
jgi:hydrogenase nickel incorporation protein HypB